MTPKFQFYGLVEIINLHHYIYYQLDNIICLGPQYSPINIRRHSFQGLGLTCQRRFISFQGTKQLTLKRWWLPQVLGCSSKGFSVWEIPNTININHLINEHVFNSHLTKTRASLQTCLLSLSTSISTDLSVGGAFLGTPSGQFFLVLQDWQLRDSGLSSNLGFDSHLKYITLLTSFQAETVWRFNSPLF